MNTGIGDAENLAWKLALVVDGRADERLLDTYEAERRPIAENVLATTSGLTEIVLGEGRAARLLRDHVAVPLLKSAWLQRRIFDRSSQLQVSYRRGPLGAGLPSPGLRQGDRVPDRLCTRTDGTTIRLHEALGPEWVLLEPASLAGVAKARLGNVAVLRGSYSDALLMRPDGHLAWRGSKPGELEAWLDATLRRRVGAPHPSERCDTRQTEDAEN